MATKPELNIAVAYAKNKASEYNENFNRLLDYIEEVSEELNLKVNTINSQLSSSVLSNLQSVYPIGSLYIGINDNCPIANLFGTWEKVAEGLCLQGATGSQVPGETVEAGLPNITGESATIVVETSFSGTKGAITSTNKGNNTVKTADHTKDKGVISIDASKSSSIYGNSDTVQPASYTGNYIIKATSGITTEAALDAFNMIKEYERKQNLLSDIEVIPSVENNTDYIAEYDGFLMINLWKPASTSGSTRQIRINGILFRQGIQGLTSGYAGETSTIPLKKGDVWSVDYSDDMFFYGRWYKLRDYEGRA